MTGSVAPVKMWHRSRGLKDTDMFTVLRYDQRSDVDRQAAWQASRMQGVGGSDMSSIMGLNPYATPYDVWLKKTGRAQQEDISDKWAVLKGNTLEGILIKRFAKLHPEMEVLVGAKYTLISKTHPCMRANLDAILYDKTSRTFGVLEIKTANASRGRNDWHDDNGDITYPDYYYPQVAHYLAVTGWQWGYFYADIGESEPVEVKFSRDEDDIQAVIRSAEDFWGYVQRNEMPDLTGIDIVKAFPEDDGTTTEIYDKEFDDLCDRYSQINNDMSILKLQKADISDKLKTYFEKNATAVSDTWKASYKTTHYKGYTKVVQPYDARILRVSVNKKPSHK